MVKLPHLPRICEIWGKLVDDGDLLIRSGLQYESGRQIGTLTSIPQDYLRFSAIQWSYTRCARLIVSIAALC